MDRRNKGDAEPNLLELAQALLGSGESRRGREMLDRYIQEADGAEQMAARHLESGIACELVSDWQAASDYYRRGLALEPVDCVQAYFLHNNFGFVLNHLGRHELAEQHCRLAIGEDPLRHNAWKNLGIALEGRQLHGEAAKAYITAVRACPRDPRALGHLASMVEAHHDSVAARFPDIDTILARLWMAVEVTQAGDG